MMDCPIQTRMKRVGMHQSFSPLQLKPLKIRTMSQKPKWKQSQSNGIRVFSTRRGCPCFWIIWGLISTNILSDEWYFSNCYSPSLLIDQFLGGKRSEATSETRQIRVVVQSTIPTDNPTFQITTVKLDGHNHLAWSSP